MNTKTVYAYDSNFKYTGEKILDHTDKDPFGYFNIPGNCTDVEPPSAKEGFDLYWNGTAWEYKAIEKEHEPDPPTLDELKQQKIQEFKYKRDRDEIEVIEYNNSAFDYDDKARERMRIAEKALVDNELPSQAWTCADNSSTELTVQDFKNINTLAAQRSGALHVKYNELKAQVNASADKDELEQIVW